MNANVLDLAERRSALENRELRALCSMMWLIGYRLQTYIDRYLKDLEVGDYDGLVAIIWNFGMIETDLSRTGDFVLKDNKSVVERARTLASNFRHVLNVLGRYPNPHLRLVGNPDTCAILIKDLRDNYNKLSKYIEPLSKKWEQIAESKTC